MCGIVAYIGEQEAYPILINGLQRLEYRGYDSAGIAVMNEQLHLYKKKGKVADLEEFVNGMQEIMNEEPEEGGGDEDEDDDDDEPKEELNVQWNRLRPEKALARRVVLELRERPFRAVLIARLCFNTASWVSPLLGLSGVKPREHLVATALGIALPMLLTCWAFAFGFDVFGIWTPR